MCRYVLLYITLYWHLLFAAMPALATIPSVYDYDIKQWTSGEGLSSNSVRAITQDNLGYVWFGTLYGLNRFDGDQFDLFTTEQYPALASNAITRLLTDSSGRIWVGTKAGLSILDPDTLQLERLPIFSEVTSLLEVAPGEVWVAADQLFSVKDAAVRRVEQVKSVVSQLTQADGAIWVASSEYLFQRDTGGSWHQFPLPPELVQNPIYDLTFTNEGLYIASETGLYRLHPDGHINLHLLPDQTSAPVYQILQEDSGATWLSSYRKLYFQFQQQPWQTVTTAELGSAPWFSSIYKDRDNNIWLGSFSDGVFLASRSQIRRVVPGADPVIRSLSLTPQGQLLFASQTDVGILTAEGHYQPLIDDTKIQGQTVHDVLWLDSERLWLGLDRGLFQFSTKDADWFVPFPELQGQSIRVLQAATAGGVWIGALQGLFYADNTQLTALPFNSALESRQVTALSQNKDNLVFGTSRGLYQWQEQRLSRLGIGTALYHAYILAVMILSDNTILASTLDDGIFVQVPGQAWTQLHNANGLPHGPALSFHYHQATGWLWISTHKGIFRLWRNSLAQAATQGFMLEEVLSPYVRQMGSISSRCCNGAGHAKVAYWQQQLWYPTLRGLVAVPEQFVSSAPSGLRPVLKKLSAHKQYPLSGSQSRQVVEQDERNLSIHYSAIEFNRPQSLVFRYQLAGFEQDWHEVSQRREAIYTNLPPGNFEFIVQVKYRHQSWQDAAQAQITLQIPRRFDETLLYRLLWLLLFICLLYGLFWLYQQNHLFKQDELANLVRLRTQELEQTNKKLNDLNEQLSLLTHRDMTTGLRNLRFMQEQLPKDIEHFQCNRLSLTQQGKTIALLLLELQDYQQLLVQYGTNTADLVLQQLSALLIRETGGSDYVVRYGAERFVVVFRDIRLEQVAQYCRRLLTQLTAVELTLTEGHKIRADIIAGYALYPLPLVGGQLLNWEISMQLAEQALIRLKTLGGSNQVATLTFDPHLDAFEFEESLDLESQITKFMHDGLLKLTSY